MTLLCPLLSFMFIDLPLAILRALIVMDGPGAVPSLQAPCFR